MDYLDRPVFEFQIDWTRLPTARFEYDLRELEIGFGPVEFAPLQEHVVHGFQFEVLAQDADAIAAVEAFFDARQGSPARLLAARDQWRPSASSRSWG